MTTTKPFPELNALDLEKRVTAELPGFTITGTLQGFAQVPGVPGYQNEFWLHGHTTHWNGDNAIFEIEDEA